MAHRVVDGLRPEGDAGAFAAVGDAEELLFDLARIRSALTAHQAAALRVAGAGDLAARSRCFCRTMLM